MAGTSPDDREKSECGDEFTKDLCGSARMWWEATNSGSLNIMRAAATPANAPKI